MKEKTSCGHQFPKCSIEENMDLKVFGCILLVFSMVSCQVLNGYINPLWMSRRGRARNYDLNAADYYGNSQSVDEGLYYDRQRLPTYDRRAYEGRMTDLLYMDERGRYHPVYQQDRLYNSGPRQSMYRVNEQQPQYNQYMQVPVAPQQQSILPPTTA